MPQLSFRGGIHPLQKTHHGKGLTNQLPIREAEAPKLVAIPLVQHIGAPCAPCVSAGDSVYMGQKIGQVRGYVSAPVHASVSGKVVAVEPRLVAGGATPLCVVIENDFQDRWDPSIAPMDPALLDRDALLSRVLEGGIVGMGGATFPAHVKLSPPKDKKIDFLLLNGAECEPYLSADHRVMLERAQGVLQGVAILQRILNASRCIIGVEANKKDAFQALEQAAQRSGVELKLMKVKYPQGSEKQLVQTLTGRQVPSGKLPMDAGCVVVNVSSAYAVYEAVALGRPLISRVVSVTGEGVNQPANLQVRIGDSVASLLRQCGGLKEDVERLVSGGPMMGIALLQEDVPVTKGMSGILALRKAQLGPREQTACIHCGRCLSGCPIHLMPFELCNDCERNDWAAAEKHGALDCIECGSCTYVCPAKREITSSIRIAKRQIMAARKK